jgi:hypothetical protein
MQQGSVAIVLAVVILLLIVFVAMTFLGSCREKYLVYPYYDDGDYADYRGNPYAFSDGNVREDARENARKNDLQFA